MYITIDYRYKVIGVINKRSTDRAKDQCNQALVYYSDLLSLPSSSFSLLLSLSPSPSPLFYSLLSLLLLFPLLSIMSPDFTTPAQSKTINLFGTNENDGKLISVEKSEGIYLLTIYLLVCQKFLKTAL